MAPADQATVWLQVQPVTAHDGGPLPPPWLSVPERQRWEGITAARRRAEFVAGRRSARELLAAAFGAVPADWLLDAPDNAAPAVLAGPQAGRPVALSHSGGWVACAVGSQAVGIDLEMPRAGRAVAALVDHVCSDAERRALAGLSDDALSRDFHRLWTVKEAWFKRRGEGISPQALAGLTTRPACDDDAEVAFSWQRADGLQLALWCAAGTRLRWVGDPAGLEAAEPQRWAVDLTR